jgi:cytochrome c oxidase accessory protein FixG
MAMHNLIDRKGKPSGEHHIEVDPVNTGATAALYKPREAIHPKLVHGPFRRLKWIAMIVLLAIYYITPWLRWDRGAGRPDQFAQVDFEGRRFYFGPIELWPQEVYYIVGLLILAALGLFLATALFGRIWCGYACPQTVWTDLFIYVERLFEGDRNQRLKLMKQPWSLAKFGRKLGKHTVWLVIAAVTGGAWVFYFGDAPSMMRALFTGTADPTLYLFVGILTFTTYALAGTMREQVCIYMCPWPRIQAAMIDTHTHQVTYRRDRGEPRGPHKKGDPWDGRGDCIDCNQCVAACPAGIDIRQGAQLECINCALCIDACDEIMEKVERPKGLIAFDSDLNIARRLHKESPRFTWLRARTVLYAGLLVAISALMLYSLATRAVLSLNVIRDRSPAYVVLADGAVRNGYTLKLANMQAEGMALTVRLEGDPALRLRTETGQDVPPEGLSLHLPKDAVTPVRLFVIAPKGTASGQTQVTFIAATTDGAAQARQTAGFQAP